MSYQPSNAPVKLFTFPRAPSTPTPPDDHPSRPSPNTFWLYQSGDDRSEVEAAGYFQDGRSRGLSVGDVVMCINTREGTVTHHRVQTIDRTGAASVSYSIPR